MTDPDVVDADGTSNQQDGDGADTPKDTDLPREVVDEVERLTSSVPRSTKTRSRPTKIDPMNCSTSTTSRRESATMTATMSWYSIPKGGGRRRRLGKH